MRNIARTGIRGIIVTFAKTRNGSASTPPPLSRHKELTLMCADVYRTTSVFKFTTKYAPEMGVF